MIHDALTTLIFWIERQWWQWSRHRRELALWFRFAVTLAAICAVIGLPLGYFWRFL